MNPVPQLTRRKEELQARNPRDERGQRRNRHHQWVTEDVGHPLYALIGFMRVSIDWEQFYRMVQKAFPKKNETMLLAFSEM